MKYCNDIGSVQEDKLRNLFIHMNINTGSKPVVMVDAHSDEIGFMAIFRDSEGNKVAFHSPS